MKKFTFVLGILFSLSAITVQAQSDEPFARFPSVSPDGEHIAFSYQGDIWTVPTEGGRAIRLTVHEAYESLPKWSPDGDKIAFISDRHGNDDLFVMNANGSQIQRITYHSTTDELTGWTNDNKLLFTTNRLYNQVEWEPEIHTVSAEGGTPERYFDAFGFMSTMSPNGEFVVFARGYNGIYRKNYDGPANKDLWLYHTESQTFRQLTDAEGNDMYPTFANDQALYFISERDGTHNLYRITLTDDGMPSSSPNQITNLEGDGIRYFDVSPNNQTVVMEYQTGIYTLDGNSMEPVSIEVSHDDRFYNIERKTFTEEAEEFAISPNGDLMAFVIEGEIFVKPNDPDKNRAVRVTDHPYRDRDVAFIKDENLIFSSDRNGQYDLYSLKSGQEGTDNLFESMRFETTQLTSTKEDERNPVISPNGEKIVFNRGRGKLVAADISDGSKLSEERILLDTGWATARDIAWSPDNEWLAYSLPNLDFNTEVYIQPVDGNADPVNVSKHPRPDTDPVWSPDGSKLAFLSSRNNGDNDIWFAWLTKRDWQRKELEWKKSQKPKEVTPEDTANVNVEIDFDGIYKRLQQVTSLPGNESDIAISEDGQTFYFVTNRDSRQEYNADQDLYQVNWDGNERKDLTDGDINPSDVRLNIDFNALYLRREGGTISRYNLEEDRLEHFPFQAKMTINHAKQHEQIFEEAWRTIDNGFYDPDFHGKNWDQLHDHYKPWALQASSDRDFEDVINMMLGELNASHMGFYGSERAETQSIRTGLLGVEVTPVETGARIDRVVSNSPADREMSKLHVGEIITHIDDQPVTQTDNFYQLLTDKVDTPVLLTVQNSEEEQREVTIEPTGSLSNELYEEWIEKRKELTEQYSNGRLGYIHIEGMNWPSFERFERELVASGEGKEGMVIDVRYNGGGWTTDYLLTVLNYRQHAYTIPRGATNNLDQTKTEFRDHYPFGERLPLSSWTRHSITLTNQNSYSNAEIFSHAYKQLNLGTLVGEPTFGAVISTGGAGLMGDSYIRLPFRGWFVKATDQNMEHGPAMPDIEVINPPNYRSGEDTQLRRAVDILLQQIDNDNR